MRYSFIIGTSDDFATEDDLLRYFQNGGGNLNASRFDYDLPDNVSQETIVMVGRGHAFSNDWCMDDTFSMVSQSIELESPGASRLHLDELFVAYAEMHGRHNARGTSKRLIFKPSSSLWYVDYDFIGRFGGVEGGFSLVVPTSTCDHTRIEVEYIIRKIVGVSNEV